MELSINFIVMLILSLVMFGFGMFIFRGVFSTATTQIENIPSEEAVYLEACIDEGNEVCLPVVRKKLRIGDTTVFGFAINNRITDSTFSIYTNFATAENDDPNFQVNLQEWTFVEEGSSLVSSHSIKNNEYDMIPLAYRIPKGTPSGEYVFDVYVCSTNDGGFTVRGGDPCGGAGSYIYGPKQKIYLEII